MVMKLIVLILFTIAVNILNAQNFFLATNQFTTSFYNPSKNKLVLDAYYLNEFFIKEWNNKGVSVCYTKNKSSILTQLQRKGNSKFSENIFSITYSQILSPKLRISLGNRTFTTQQQEYKNSTNPIFPFISLNVKPTKIIEVMLCAETIKKGILPDKINVLIKRKFSEKIHLLVGAIFSNDNYFSFSTGVLYKVIDNLDLELNINTGMFPAHFGIKYTYKKNTIIISNKFHQLLGQSIGAQIQFIII